MGNCLLASNRTGCLEQMSSQPQRCLSLGSVVAASLECCGGDLSAEQGLDVGWLGSPNTDMAWLCPGTTSGALFCQAYNTRLLSVYLSDKLSVLEH